uniref:Uncharacterized protein n=1 Tax=Siphoviridae sp. ctMgg26 TaxID=2825462 RepID=A0A8S5PZ06_9CAUD|nr:MAG TPA: hypothetical protein [Siphoviridae sp. ctMgg26]
MTRVNIMESIQNAICETIFEKWKHEGIICGWSSEHINFEIDGKEYILLLEEIQNDENFSQFKIVKL